MRFLILLVFSFTFSVTAFSAPVTWYLQNVAFDDGATASGSFVYDADTGNYSNVQSTTTDSGSSDSSASFQWDDLDQRWQEVNPAVNGLNGWYYGDATINLEGWSYREWNSNDFPFPTDASNLGIHASYACDSFYFIGCDEVSGVPVLLMNFATDLTNAGGTIAIDSMAEMRCSFGWGSCDAPAFSGSRSSISGVITTVPIPAAVWLFGSALAGLGWIRRKQAA